jgi:hypothetical protein
LFDPDDHALAVDRSRREADRLGNLEAGRVTDSQDHAMFQIVHGGEEAGSWTTPLRDERRHMTPRHRLPIELPDQSKDTNSQFRQTVISGNAKYKSQNYREAI